MMFDQSLFNFIVGALGTIGGWWLNTMWKATRDLETKVAAIDVLVAGHYVRRDDLDKLMAAVFTKLDRIEGKLDGKADK